MLQNRLSESHFGGGIPHYPEGRILAIPPHCCWTLPSNEPPVGRISFQEHGRRGRRLVDVSVRDRVLRDMLYSYRRQHIIRDQTEYFMVSVHLLLAPN